VIVRSGMTTLPLLTAITDVLGEDPDFSGGERGTRTLDLGIMSATRTLAGPRLVYFEGLHRPFQGYVEHEKGIPISCSPNP
jgi:hypothetical protein